MPQLVELQTFEAGAHSLDFPGSSCVAPESIFQLELQLHSSNYIRSQISVVSFVGLSSRESIIVADRRCIQEDEQLTMVPFKGPRLIVSSSAT